MKRNGVLNSDISRVLSSMGHTDSITIGDCGLPIPRDVEKIDLSLSLGEPGFIKVLKIVLSDMKVEKIVLAEEIKEENLSILTQINEIFAGTGIYIEFVPHQRLKELTKESKAVIRTGEASPYSNVILYSGCIFG